MTLSDITDAFLKVAESKLENGLRKILHSEGHLVLLQKPGSVEKRMRTEYSGIVKALNSAGKSLSEQDFYYEQINLKTSFRAAYDRLVDKYKP